MVVGLALDHEDAVRARFGLHPFLRPLEMRVGGALAEPQHAGGPGGAARGARVEVGERVPDELVGEAEDARGLADRREADEAVDRESLTWTSRRW